MAVDVLTLKYPAASYGASDLQRSGNSRQQVRNPRRSSLIQCITDLPSGSVLEQSGNLSILIDAAACLLLAQIPGDADPVLALYPMFFATAVQWLAYTQAAGFNSATIFSTNNLRQCFAGLAEYLYSREEKHLARFRFYGGTLLCFHAGVIYCWFCMKLWGVRSIYACLLPLAAGLFMTWRDSDSSHS